MQKKILKQYYFIVLHIFGLIGFLFTFVFIGMQFNLFSVKGSIAERNSFFKNTASTTPIKVDDYRCTDGTKVCDIFLTPEWQTVSYGLQKDAPVLERVSKETGVPVRLLVSLAVPEQLRFFSSERDVYKKYFEPLKILGSMSQFSLGVTGIKPHTAEEIENNLVSTTSLYYLGKDLETKLSYREGEDRDKEQFARLTNSKDHYYSYLYTAFFIKQIDSAWVRAGFPIAKNNEGVYATLFNLGFAKSRPNANPKIGGAFIKIGGRNYTYGEIAARFLESEELIKQFPKE